MQQLGIEGIGQQKATLSDWKKQNGIFTHKSDICEKQWTAWNEIESPCDFLSEYGGEAFGFGATEKAAILDFCEKENIKPPFWW